MNPADIFMKLMEVLVLFLIVLLFLPPAIDFVKGFRPKDDGRGER